MAAHWGFFRHALVTLDASERACLLARRRYDARLRIGSHPYRIVAGEKYLLPICSLTLLGPGTSGRASLDVLVDTGATFSVFPNRAAEDVGLPLPRSPNFPLRFGSSVLPGRRTTAYVELDGRRFRTDVVFVERLLFRFALLGRRGIFARFREVAFLERRPSPAVEFRR